MENKEDKKELDDIIGEINKVAKDLVDEYLSKQKDLAEFEKELKKNKDQLTPGIQGES